MADLPDPNPIAAANRRTARRRLIPHDAACALCGQGDPDLLEDHHVLGVAASDEVRVWLCLNCHRQQTHAQQDQQALPPSGRYRPPADTSVERIGRALQALAVFLTGLVHWLNDAADELFGVVAGWDSYNPDWRAELWAI